MNEDYSVINKKMLDVLADKMKFASNKVIELLTNMGYKVIDTNTLLGEIEYNGAKYHFTAKPAGYTLNPTTYCLATRTDETLKAITQCVPNKEDYLIVMYLPIVLETNTPQVIFSSYFDVIKIAQE